MRPHVRTAIAGVVVAVAAAVLAASAFAHPTRDSHKNQVTQTPIRAVLNGVMDVKKGKLGRFNFRIHVTKTGVVSGHGDYNGGGSNYVQLTQITSFSCSASHVSVSAVALANHTQATVPVTISATDGGAGLGAGGDTFSISFGKYARSGAPIAGKVFIKGCS